MGDECGFSECYCSSGKGILRGSKCNCHMPLGGSDDASIISKVAANLRLSIQQITVVLKHVPLPLTVQISAQEKLFKSKISS